MASEHRARVVPFSADPEDTRLTLMVECFECPQAPLRWGFLMDTAENVAFLEAEAIRHNTGLANREFSLSAQTDGTIADTTDESRTP